MLIYVKICIALRSLKDKKEIENRTTLVYSPCEKVSMNYSYTYLNNIHSPLKETTLMGLKCYKRCLGVYKRELMGQIISE